MAEKKINPKLATYRHAESLIADQSDSDLELPREHPLASSSDEPSQSSIESQQTDRRQVGVKVIFFGTPDFSAAVLRHVIKKTNHDVVAVVTKPDRERGRGRHILKTPVKEVAETLLPGIPILQPERASVPEVIEQLKGLHADVFLIVAFGELVSKELIEVPQKGCYNTHASLLPAYRGAAPIQRALLDGCTETGITIFQLQPTMDTGDMVWQGSCPIDSDMNFGELKDRLLEVAKQGVIALLDDVARSNIHLKPQPERGVSKAPKIKSEELVLDQYDNIVALHNRVRAFAPHPGAYFMIAYKEEEWVLKVLKTHVLPDQVNKTREWVAMPDGMLALTTMQGTLVFDRVQLAGKREMSSADFLRGHTLSDIRFV